ncbi:6044_t:CDS:2 [Acaulospora colombiana]|uniref:6044_t:CDS:1 n=1 Tax=Acaulospora colombiana TaxID=27376 RepID=A0ACA9LVL5_9GLOM|nr:6044_t:CDS:2 [Acaulospora colombiana]
MSISSFASIRRTDVMRFVIQLCGKDLFIKIIPEMPSNIVNPESKSENIPGGYPTTPKPDQYEKDSTPILESRPPQDPNRPSSANNVKPTAENQSNNVQQGSNGSSIDMVKNEIPETRSPLPQNALESYSRDLNAVERPTSGNKENGVRNEVVRSNDSHKEISSASPFISKDSIPFDLNGDYNIKNEDDSTNDSTTTPIETSSESMTSRGESNEDYTMRYHTTPESSASRDRNTGNHTRGHHITPIKTSENLTSKDENTGNYAREYRMTTSPESLKNESPHYNTPTDTITNGSSSTDHKNNIVNVLYTMKEINPDEDANDVKKSDRSPPKTKTKDKINSKIGSLKSKISRLMKK